MVGILLAVAVGVVVAGVEVDGVRLTLDAGVGKIVVRVPGIDVPTEGLVASRVEATGILIGVLEHPISRKITPNRKAILNLFIVSAP